MTSFVWPDTLQAPFLSKLTNGALYGTLGFTEVGRKVGTR